MLSKKFSSKTLPFLLIALFAVLLLARYAFGWIQFYQVSTNSMEPALPVGKKVFCSNLIHAERGNMVCYKDTTQGIPGIRKCAVEVFIGRLVAIGGDEIALKNGRAWVNGQATEENLHLRFLYAVSQKDYQANRAFFSRLGPDRQGTRLLPDNLLFFLDDAEANALRGRANCQLQEHSVPESKGFYPFMQQLFGQNSAWTLDNFGPVSVPSGMVFILGDNRHNSEDSRFRGFVPVEDVTGVLVAQW